jgi:hypothetical protein
MTVSPLETTRSSSRVPPERSSKTRPSGKSAGAMVNSATVVTSATLPPRSVREYDRLDATLLWPPGSSPALRAA